MKKLKEEEKKRGGGDKKDKVAPVPVSSVKKRVLELEEERKKAEAASPTVGRRASVIPSPVNLIGVGAGAGAVVGGGGGVEAVEEVRRNDKKEESKLSTQEESVESEKAEDVGNQSSTVIPSAIPLIPIKTDQISTNDGTETLAEETAPVERTVSDSSEAESPIIGRKLNTRYGSFGPTAPEMSSIDSSDTLIIKAPSKEEESKAPLEDTIQEKESVSENSTQTVNEGDRTRKSSANSSRPGSSIADTNTSFKTAGSEDGRSIGESEEEGQLNWQESRVQVE